MRRRSVPSRLRFRPRPRRSACLGGGNLRERGGAIATSGPYRFGVRRGPQSAVVSVRSTGPVTRHTLPGAPNPRSRRSVRVTRISGGLGRGSAALLTTALGHLAVHAFCAPRARLRTSGARSGLTFTWRRGLATHRATTVVLGGILASTASGREYRHLPSRIPPRFVPAARTRRLALRRTCPPLGSPPGSRPSCRSAPPNDSQPHADRLPNRR